MLVPGKWHGKNSCKIWGRCNKVLWIFRYTILYSNNLHNFNLQFGYNIMTIEEKIKYPLKNDELSNYNQNR